MIFAPAVPSPALANQAQADNATVLITGYMDVVGGCHFSSPAADALVAKDCERQRNSSVVRLPYNCAGVVVGLQDEHATTVGVLTARHCVMPTRELDAGDVTLLDPEQESIKVQFHDGDVGDFIGVAVGAFEKDDVALIRVDTKRPHGTVGSPVFNVADGAQLYVIGHSHQHPWGLKYARSINGLRPTGIEDWAHTSMIECPTCAAGDSGAGVWDSHWKLVGIFNALTAQYGLFTSSQRIRDGLGTR
jgi:hypothetical protein